jgi:Basic region leucine zipper
MHVLIVHVAESHYFSLPGYDYTTRTLPEMYGSTELPTTIPASPYAASLGSPLVSPILPHQRSQTNLALCSAGSSSDRETTQEKRRRNNAASARFRMKKKRREQELEQASAGLSRQVNELEKAVSKLEVENKWLRELITSEDDEDEKDA